MPNFEHIFSCRYKCLFSCFSSLEEPLSGSLEIDKLAHFKTAFHHALILQKADVADLLLRQGADINLEFDDGDTPLQYVCKNSMEELVELLLEHGATDTSNKARIDAEENNICNVNQILLNQCKFVSFIVSSFHA